MSPNFLASAVTAVRSRPYPGTGRLGAAHGLPLSAGVASPFSASPVVPVVSLSLLLRSLAAAQGRQLCHSSSPPRRHRLPASLSVSLTLSLCGAAVLLFCTFALLPALHFALITSNSGGLQSVSPAISYSLGDTAAFLYREQCIWHMLRSVCFVVKPLSDH